MTDAEISLFIGGLVACYFSGLKIGKFIKLIRELGNGA